METMVKVARPVFGERYEPERTYAIWQRYRARTRRAQTRFFGYYSVPIHRTICVASGVFLRDRKKVCKGKIERCVIVWINWAPKFTDTRVVPLKSETLLRSKHRCGDEMTAQVLVASSKNQWKNQCS